MTNATPARHSCDCQGMAHMIDEPGIPITFDQTTGEHQLHSSHDNTSHTIPLYYCFLCGGALPKSRRDALFATVTDTERMRLNALIGDMSSLEQAAEGFGPPTHQSAHGSSKTEPAESSQAPHIENYKTARYSNLSETVDVILIEYGIGKVRATYTGKPIDQAP